MTDKDPADPAAWLAALPLGTVLLDHENQAWQVRTAYDYEGNEPPRVFRAVQGVAGDPFDLDDADDIHTVLEFAPFTVLWMPPVGEALVV